MTSMTDAHLLMYGAGSGLDGVAAVIEEIGLHRAVDVLAHELVFRSCLEEIVDIVGGSLPVVFSFSHAGQTQDKRIVLGDGPAALPATVLRIDAAEAATCLFGPRECATSASLRIEWPDLWAGMEALQPGYAPPAAALDAGRRLQGVLDRKSVSDLGQLAVKYQSDKWGVHRYTPHYQHHFEPYADRQLRVLEIGVGGYQHDQGGSSLRMWKHFFPRGLVYGIDLYDKSALDEQRIRTCQVDQSKAVELQAFAEEFGPFDIIIDDGSHVSNDVIVSFETLFPYLRPGGQYVVEDLQTSYWEFPADPGFTDPKSSVGFIKGLVEGLNHPEILSMSNRSPRPTDEWISGLHLYHNMAFIEKHGNHVASPVVPLIEQAIVASQQDSENFAEPGVA
jgi:8-demethyl-8-alpha-L-rhamnosyltetracenomycin-C 2'-O-methyltransferase